jgi:hypothetical protein
MKIFKFLLVIILVTLYLSPVWSLSADEAQSYSFAGSALSSSTTNNLAATSIALESSTLAEAHAESSLAHSRTDLEKKQQFQMENGYIGLTDDTSLWVGPLGASLNVKY